MFRINWRAELDRLKIGVRSETRYLVLAFCCAALPVGLIAFRKHGHVYSVFARQGAQQSQFGLNGTVKRCHCQGIDIDCELRLRHLVVSERGGHCSKAADFPNQHSDANAMDLTSIVDLLCTLRIQSSPVCADSELPLCFENKRVERCTNIIVGLRGDRGLSEGRVSASQHFAKTVHQIQEGLAHGVPPNVHFLHYIL